ncbi:MAG: glycoside hydrolase family 9 protein [Lachnospiraceae bacterium]|nr:glycoside hydrolase family 9 protein [Lachnospiraceae bacterium]
MRFNLGAKKHISPDRSRLAEKRKRLPVRATATLLAGVLATSTLSGCSAADLPFWPTHMLQTSEGASESGADDSFTTLGLTPDLDYEKPVIEAHIEIDQMGYLPESRKLAIFRGEELGETFSVVSVDSREVVYTGDIKSKTEARGGETFYYGDFTDLTVEGTYYIQTDVIGYSYPFSIKKDLYDGVLETALKQYYLNRCGMSLTEKYAAEGARSACHTDPVTLQQDAEVSLDVTGGWHTGQSGDRDVIQGCNTIEALLLAYEYNSAAFDDGVDIPESGDGIPDILNELKVETDWLLKMQDPSTGAVYEGIISTDQGKGLENPCHILGIDMDSTLAFASALGYFSYLYQTVDTAYATVCLQAADRAMKYAAKFIDTVDQDKYFRAATMLYRATGYYTYRMIVENYCTGRTEYNMSDNVVFTGVVTYLATKQKTNSAICSVMMNDLRSYAEDMSDARKDTLFLMGEKSKTVENSTLLSEIARLSVVNYIISSNEYVNIMERYLHYFMGCNPYNICYVGQYGSVNISDTEAGRDILRQPEQDAYFIVLLAGVSAGSEVNATSSD